MKECLLKDMDALYTVDLATGDRFWGGDQDWYSTTFRQKAGCGPTTATNILSYFSQTQPEKSKLWSSSSYSLEGYQGMMEKVWDDVTPTTMGLYSISDMGAGTVAFAKRYGVDLVSKELDLSVLKRGNTSLLDAKDFIDSALQMNSPVAFLNYSSGKVENLDSWHWVTLVGLNSRNNSLEATIVDNGAKFCIDFGLWYESSLMGGGLVSFQDKV